jgi:hypothetical protein
MKAFQYKQVTVMAFYQSISSKYGSLDLNHICLSL